VCWVDGGGGGKQHGETEERDKEKKKTRRLLGLEKVFGPVLGAWLTD
jgi:hypothetical protein